MKRSFGGCSTENFISYKDKFDEVMNDAGEPILESKQTFCHTDDDLPDFEYKYVVRCWDLPRFGSEQHAISIELFMVALPQYWCEDRIEGVMDYNGVDSIDYVYTDMLLDYSPRLADEYVDYDEENDDGFYHIEENPDAVDMLNACASVLDAINGMRGFYLDRAWNMIGTNGWDALREVLMGEDMIMATLARNGY